MNNPALKAPKKAKLRQEKTRNRMIVKDLEGHYREKNDPINLRNGERRRADLGKRKEDSKNRINFPDSIPEGLTWRKLRWHQPWGQQRWTQL